MSDEGAVSNICQDFNSKAGCQASDDSGDCANGQLHIKVCSHFNTPAGCKHGTKCRYPHYRLCSDYMLSQEKDNSSIFAGQNSAANFVPEDDNSNGTSPQSAGSDPFPAAAACPCGGSRLHFITCRKFFTANGCTDSRCTLPHWILPPRVEESPTRDENESPAGAGGAKREHGRKKHDPFAVDPDDVINNAMSEQQHRNQQATTAAMNIDTTVEILLPGSATIVDLAQVNDSFLSMLLQIPQQHQVQQVQHQHQSTSKAAAASSASSSSIPQLLALDFHNVTDICLPDQPIFAAPGAANLPKVVVSYVGAGRPGHVGIRDHTRASIQQRMANNQVSMGIMVFKKIRAGDIATANMVASKRHAVELLMKFNRVEKCLFVDDSADNVAVVGSTSDARVHTLLFKGRTPAELSDAIGEKLSQQKM